VIPVQAAFITSHSPVIQRKWPHRLQLEPRPNAGKQSYVVVGAKSRQVALAQELLYCLQCGRFSNTIKVQVHPGELIHLCTLAQSLQAQKCVDLCIPALLAFPQEKLLQEDVIWHLFACLQMHDVHSSRPELSSLFSAIESKLMATWGDAAVVANSKELTMSFSHLPIEVVRHWVQSEQLCADSENTVVYVLNGWAARNKGEVGGKKAHPLTKEEQTTLLSESIRLPALSTSYRLAILAHVHWFLPKELQFKACALLGSGLFTESPQEAERLVAAGTFPHAWLLGKPRPGAAGSSAAQPGAAAGDAGGAGPFTQTGAAAGGGTSASAGALPEIRLEAGEKELQAAIASVLKGKPGTTAVAAGPTRIIQGFALQAGFEITQAPSASGRVHCAPHMRFATDTEGVHPWRAWASVAAKVQLCAQRSDAPGVFSHTAQVAAALENVPVSWPHFFGPEPISSVQELSGFVVGGRLVVVARVLELQ